jgi:hypothetical protein
VVVSKLAAGTAHARERKSVISKLLAGADSGSSLRPGIGNGKELAKRPWLR